MSIENVTSEELIEYLLRFRFRIDFPGGHRVGVEVSPVMDRRLQIASLQLEKGANNLFPMKDENNSSFYTFVFSPTFHQDLHKNTLWTVFNVYESAGMVFGKGRN